MHKYYIILSILLCSLSINGQSVEQKVDSIQLLIENATEDTVKAKHYATQGALYVYSDPNKAMQLLHKSLAFSKKIGFEKTLAYTYRYLFNVHDVLGSHSDSLMTYINLLNDLYQETGKVEYEVRLHWNRAIYYRNFGQNDKVIESYLKALKLVRKHNFQKNEEARLLGNIGTIFDINGDYEDALKYYKQAAPLFGKDKMGTAITYFNMAIIYQDQFNEIDSALNLLDKAYNISDEYDNYSLMAEILVSKGSCYDDKGQYKRANQHYKKALQLTEQYNLGENFISIYSTYSEHYYKRKQYKIAIQYSDKAIALSQEKEDNRFLKSLYELQNKSYSEVGDYKNAHTVQSKLMTHLDSLKSTELQGKVKELQTEYEVGQKEMENELLRAEKEMDKAALRSKTAITAGLIAILLLVGGWSFFIYRNSQQRKKYNTILEQKVDERTRELQQANYELRTFNYIASHDIKEPIRVIGGYAGLVFKKLPDDLKESLGDYFDTIKRSTNQLYTLIEDFANYTTMSKNEIIKTQDVDLNYLIFTIIDNLQESIEKYDGEVLMSNLPTIQSSNSLLFTTLKNLIENGLKYNRSENPIVNVSYNQTKTHHQIIVSDNGIGIKKDYHKKVFEMFKRLHNREIYEGSGIGLAIVKLSIDKLGGNVEVESEEGRGSRFVLQLPL